MHPVRRWLAIPVLISGLAPMAWASGVRVPAQQPTIAAALATAAETIYVANGDYPEDVVLIRPVVIVAYDGSNSFYHYVRAPRVRSVTTTNSGYPSYLKGLHVTGGFRHLANLAFSGRVEVEACRVDSGLVSSPFASVLNVRLCQFFGSVDLSVVAGQFSDNVVIGGGVRMAFEQDMLVTGNYVQGPAPVGLDMVFANPGGLVIDNRVRGTTVGIRASGHESPTLMGNLIEDCAAAGLEVAGGFGGSITVLGNTVRRVGGHGLWVAATSPNAEIRSNVIEDAGGCGILAAAGALQVGSLALNTIRGTGAEGIRLDSGLAFATPVQGNTVVSTVGDGIRVSSPVALVGNVVGRSGGHGFSVDATAGHTTLRSNTSYLNALSAFRYAAGSNDTIRLNVGYGSSRYGLERSGAGPGVVGCNDWFGNSLGATSGVGVGASDLAVHPQFCSLPADDVRLSAGSPLLGAPGCGTVGALGGGCAVTTDVGSSARDPVGGLTVWPTPSQGEVRFQLDGPIATGTLEVFDARGARVWQAPVERGVSELRWSGRTTSGLHVRPGIYFALYTAPGLVRSARVVVDR